MLGVSRTDVHGDVIDHVLWGLLKREVQSQELIAALGLTAGRYYRRIKQPDYPDAEELRRIGAHFDIDPVELQERFGLVQPTTRGFRAIRGDNPTPEQL